MTTQQIEQATSIFKEKLTEWSDDQGKDINAYEYEKRYVEAMQSIEKDVLQVIAGTEQRSRNSKKSSDQRGENRSFKAPHIVQDPGQFPYQQLSTGVDVLFWAARSVQPSRGHTESGQRDRCISQTDRKPLSPLW